MPRDDDWGPPAVTIDRPRLLRLLDVAPRAPVVQVTAPAGSGKTALLTQWRHELRVADAADVAWVTCDEANDSPADFWSAVAAALTSTGVPSDPPRQTAPDAALRARPKVVIQRLKAARRDVVIVLDDFHLVLDPETLADVSFLAHHLPGRTRLVLSSRFDPTVRLTKLRLARQVKELRFAELAFTPCEVSQLVSAVGIALEHEETDLLHQRTEGWVAGVQLCLMSMGGSRSPCEVVRDLSSNDASIAGYLMEQVLAEMDPASRSFLLDTSVVDEITPRLAEHLTGRRDSAAMLQRLAQRTGFMFPVPGADHGYRYHALFVGLLRSELRLHDRARHEALQRKVAELLIREERPMEALPHAVAAEAWDAAASALLEATAHDFATGRHGDLAPWVAHFPATRLNGDPRVTVTAGSLALLAEDLERGRSLLQQAATSMDVLEPDERQRCESMHDVLLALCHRFENHHEAVVQDLPADGPAAADALIRSCWFSLRAASLIRIGRTTEAVTAAQRALRLCAKDETWSAIDALETLTLAAILDGDLHAGRQFADVAWQLLGTGRATYIGRPMTLHVCRVWMALDEGRFDDAAQALVDAQDGRFGEFDLGDRLVVQAAEARRSLHVDGDARAALAAIAVLGAAQLPSSWLGDQLLAFLTVECLVSVGQFEQARSVAHHHEVTSPVPPGVAGLSAWVRARELLAQTMAHGVRGIEGDPRLANEWARHAVTLEAALAPPSHVRGALGVRHLLTSALIEHHAGHDNEASHILNIVLDEVALHGWRLPFYELGASAHSLLRAERERIGEHGELLTRLLQELHTHEVARSSGLVAPLSNREDEVLQYLPTPLDRDELCAILFISKNTLKSHLRSIYRKLGVDSRRDAVQKARALELL
ncbi:MAG: LuxR C-terminal-related transcriptional regulator [Aeromicrobium sp.]